MRRGNKKRKREEEERRRSKKRKRKDIAKSFQKGHEKPFKEPKFYDAARPLAEE